jgi:hypothetical protein
MTNTVNITENVSKATEVAISYDTTGSMSPAIANVRKHIEKTCEELFQDIPNLRIGLIAHGDYCDGDNCMRVLPLTNDRAKIFEFIRSAPNTGGGDADECYELVLREAKGLGWTPGGSGKAFVMIGDAAPHAPDYAANKDQIDWRVELSALKEMGINVYPLQCLYRERNGANQFWSTISEVCSTPLLKLDSFNESNEALKGFAYASAGSEAFKNYEAKIGCCASPETNVRNARLRKEALKYDATEEGSTE